MKKIFFLLLAVSLCSILGCTGTTIYMDNNKYEEPVLQDKGVIHFMRPSGFGFAVQFQVWEGYDLVGVSQAKSYFIHLAEPGKHLYIGRAENKHAVEVDVEAGKSYFVLLQAKMGGMKARMAFIPVTRGSEFWDLVEAYKTNLNYTTRNEEEISKWTQMKQDAIVKEMDEILDFLKTPEGSAYITYLSREDGR